MKRICIAGILALLLVTPCLSQAQQKAIEGWGRTKWGMTLQQVRALYPNVQSASGTIVHRWAVTYGHPKTADLILRDVPVNGPFEVMFFFTEGRLRHVVLRPQTVFTMQQAREVAADLRSQYGGFVTDSGNAVAATAQPVLRNLTAPARVQFRFDASKPQDTYIQYDYLQSFGAGAKLEERRRNPNL